MQTLDVIGLLCIFQIMMPFIWPVMRLIIFLNQLKNLLEIKTYQQTYSEYKLKM